MKKEFLNNSYVYLHRRLDTNDVFYIGIGSSLKFRRAFDSSNRNKFWKNIVRKTNYIIGVIYKNITYEQACKYEINLIAMYGKRDLGLGNLVNMTDGGQGTTRIKVTEETKIKSKKYKVGKVLSEETKEKIRQKALGRKWTKERKIKFSEYRKKVCLSSEYKLQRKLKMTGKKHSEETKVKMSKSHKGKVFSNHSKQKMSISKKLLIVPKERIEKLIESKKKLILNLETGVFYKGIEEASFSKNLSIHKLGYYLRKGDMNKTSFIYV